MASPKHGPRHWRFVAQSLRDLLGRGYPISIFWGEAEEAFNLIAERFRIITLFSHQETGHRLSFLRDRRCKEWCTDREIPWQEYAQDGTIRGRKHRRGFAEHVDKFLASPLVANVKPGPLMVGKEILDLPAAIPQNSGELDFLDTREAAGVFPDRPGFYQRIYGGDLPEYPSFQPGGESPAWQYLRTFTSGRAQGYASQLGNPTLSRKSCSRVSTYLAWGCLSVKQVFQWSSQLTLNPEYVFDLKSFRERLWWRAHYYQKLEAEWQIEMEPINRALELDRSRDERLLQAFFAGQTGVPMVDAGIRCLQQTGWLNFRCRAMLVTYATFTLWLDWRPVATYLSSIFLDYDPGIHYGQFQMQAGLTGYHPPRVYNPYKQGEDKDPDGVFVHTWVPELKNIPAPFCHYPHRLTELEKTMYGFNAINYPAPLVDFAEANARNMDKYWKARHSTAAQGNLMGVWLKHVLPETRQQYVAGENGTPRRMS